MPAVHVFQHLPHEGLAAFRPVLDARGWSVRLNATPVEGVDAAVAAAADLLIVMGGPCGVYEAETYPYLAEEVAVLRARIAAGRPVLGVCLGAQLIAAALGARVFKGPVQEIGWHPVALTGAGAASPLAPLADVPLLHWHGDTFDLPEGVELLASTPAYAHQAFRRGPALLALQFHPEADGAEFEHWLCGADGGLRRHGLSVPQLREAARLHGPAAGRAGQAMLAAWLDALPL